VKSKEFERGRKYCILEGEPRGRDARVREEVVTIGDIQIYYLKEKINHILNHYTYMLYLFITTHLI
jgi:hypothetical protein